MEFNFTPFFLSTALSFFAVAKAMPVKLALYKEKNEAKYTTHSNCALGSLYDLLAVDKDINLF